jgi:hypothetical protein
MDHHDATAATLFFHHFLHRYDQNAYRLHQTLENLFLQITPECHIRYESLRWQQFLSDPHGGPYAGNINLTSATFSVASSYPYDGSDFWDLIAAKGSQGSQGNQGDQGEQGSQGDQGSQGSQGEVFGYVRRGTIKNAGFGLYYTQKGGE